ncbi:MAG: quinone-dependent dihydroorotate dehydrogenase [Polyangiaceae bacterium]|nr:quinone-dependent dihydroorotate dehydrogenase [Polyangiaceae bacterium]
MLYRLIRPLLYLLSAETAHHFIIGLLQWAQRVPGALRLMRLIYPGGKNQKIQALGLTFPSRVGLAAGFDKDGKVYSALGALGFGFVEVGTITGEPQPGNPTPRLFRLKKDRALINRMGFNNEGAEAAARRLAKSRQDNIVLGINIGKTKLVAAEDAIADYEKSAGLLAPFADYLVVNVSSPNTPGLRDLQAVESLRPLLTAVRQKIESIVTDRKVPLLVKIAPDLSDEDIVAVAQLSLELNLDGIIATNTTISRDGLQTNPRAVESLGAGGLSGAPLKERALEVLKMLQEELAGRLCLISAGGIENAEDARERIAAGADLVQIYSALVYEGPGLPSKIARGL